MEFTWATAVGNEHKNWWSSTVCFLSYMSGPTNKQTYSSQYFTPPGGGVKHISSWLGIVCVGAGSMVDRCIGSAIIPHEAFIIELGHWSCKTLAANPSSLPPQPHTHRLLPRFIFFLVASRCGRRRRRGSERGVDSGLARGRSARVINWLTTTNRRDAILAIVAPTGNLGTTWNALVLLLVCLNKDA